MENYVPLVVPVLSATSGSVSSSTSPSQDSMRREQETSCDLLQFKFIFRFSVGANWRNSIQETGAIRRKSKQNTKKDDGKNSDDRLRDLPEWLEELKENLVDTDLPASAHVSQESDLEHPAKGATKSRKHSIYTHFPKDRKCDVCLEPKNDKGSLQKTHWRSSTSCRKVWWLDNGRSQSPQWGESRDNHRYAVVVQDLATSWILSEKRKLHRSLSKFLDPSHKPKVVCTDNSMEFGKAEDLSWHHRTSTHQGKWHRWKTRSASKRRYFSRIATVRIGWKVVVWLCGMLLLSAKCPRPPGRTGKHRMKDDLENHSKGQWYLLEQWSKIIRFHPEIKQEFINLAREFYQESFLAMS